MAITHAELLEFWPEPELLLCGDEDITGMGLSAEAVYVLCDVGLPRHVDHYGFVATEPRVITPAGKSGPYCQIGQDDGGDFSIELATGAVWSCVTVDDLPTRFVNSTLTAFVDSLHAAARVRRDVPGTSDDEVELAHESLLAAIKSIDQPALLDDESYWSVILEQMEIGQF
jgi:hypothetical protein